MTEAVTLKDLSCVFQWENSPITPHHQIILVWTFALLGGCGGQPPPPAVQPLARVSVPALPDWTDKYAKPGQEDTRFNIGELMEKYQLSRLQAVALQNHYRDLVRSSPGEDPEAHFLAALAQVRADQLESGLNAKDLAAAPFIVVFDLDSTLYDQYYDGAECNDVTYAQSNGKPKYIKMVPGWQDAIKRIRAKGGLVVLFSANLDDPTIENLKHIQLEGRPLWRHPAIAGVMTNSHLIQQTKYEGEGRENPRKGHPVVLPSKDLRIVDPSLERAIIVDDNPSRLIQFDRVRVFKKFRANTWCTTSDPELRAAYERSMAVVIDEIESSADYAVAHNVPFTQAYLPYTWIGSVTTRFLMDTRGWPIEKAVEYVRKNPDVTDGTF